MCLAVPGRILDLEGDDALTRCGRISFEGVVKSVNLALVPEAQVDDFVIVHAGFAIAVLDQNEAQRILDEIGAIGGEARA